MRLMRRGDGSLYDIAVPGYKANLSDVLAAIALVQLDRIEAHARDPRAAVRALRRGPSPGSTGSRRSRATTATRTRCTSTSSGSTPSAQARRATSYQRALGEENIGTSIHFLPVHRLTWFRERYPEQPPLPVAERAGDEVLSLPLSPAHSDDDILDAVAAVRRVHARFTA